MGRCVTRIWAAQDDLGPLHLLGSDQLFNKIFASAAAKALLGDRGHDADWFRRALIERGITPCIPLKTNRKIPIPYDDALHCQRHKAENMFEKIKDRRRIHTRYDRCAHAFM